VKGRREHHRRMQNDFVDTKLTPDYKPEWSDLAAAGSSRTPPGVGFDRHYHDGAEYWLIFGGRALVQVGDQRFTVTKGDIVATPPGVEHDIIAIDRNAHLEMFYVATAVRDGGQPGHLHRGDDWDHVIQDLAELDGAGAATTTDNGRGDGLALEAVSAGRESR
jgi:mannose-6-phosphate isomerase-like protein (cupin superfamily)